MVRGLGHEPSMNENASSQISFDFG